MTPPKKKKAPVKPRRKTPAKKAAPRRRTPPGDLKDVHPVGLPTFDRPSLEAASVCVHTADIRARLIEFIASSEAIVGCVAWVRDADILAALAKKPTSLIMQKETMLREPSELRRRLGALKNGWRLSSLPAPFSALGPDQRIEGCRCVGQHIGRANPGAPRMHHKFLVDVGHTSPDQWFPRRAWTGSFNFSRNADASLENAVEIAHPGVADAYFAEWLRVLAISEPLDWTARMPKPQWKKAAKR